MGAPCSKCRYIGSNDVWVFTCPDVLCTTSQDKHGSKPGCSLADRGSVNEARSFRLARITDPLRKSSGAWAALPTACSGETT